MNGKKWLIRIVSYLIGIALVSVTTVIISNISSGRSATKGVPSAGVTFTSEGIPGVPVYPAAAQSTDSAGVAVPDDMRRVIGTREDRWTRYLTDDSPDEVLNWYGQAMEAAGFEQGGPRESGVVVYPHGDIRYALYVTVADGLTNIIIAVGWE